MRASDAANRIGVCKRTILRWIASGQLRTTRVWEQTSNSGGYWRHDISIDDLVEADDARHHNSVRMARWWKDRRVAS